MTFRKVGGVMDTRYSVQLDLVLKPEDNMDTEEKVRYLSSDIKERLLGYIHVRKHTFGFGEKEAYKFYILNIEQDLKHLPKPREGNLQLHTYYTYKEVTSGNREIIRESDTKSKV
jgi:hypothetical protein